MLINSCVVFSCVYAVLHKIMCGSEYREIPCKAILTTTMINSCYLFIAYTHSYRVACNVIPGTYVGKTKPVESRCNQLYYS